MTKRAIVLAVAVLSVAANAGAQFRKYVAVVEPVFHASTRNEFSRWADFFDARGQDDWAGFFRVFSGENGPTAFGSGWVHVQPDGTVQVITNAHVVKQAQKARVIFEDVHGKRRVFDSVPISYVDDRFDLAVLTLPPGSFDSGLRLRPGYQQDGTPIAAAGFPGFGHAPLWQFSTGIVSNSAARIDPAYSYLIQHTAPIGTGNSGGPLLVAEPSNSVGFEVVGVNVSVAVQRQNTGFAIPVRDVSEALARARSVAGIEADAAALRADLLAQSEALAAALRNPDANTQVLSRYISYAFVAERGFQSYAEILQVAPDPKPWLTRFYSAPIETMRACIHLRIRGELENLGGISTIRPLGILWLGDRSDERSGEACTRYSVGGRRIEIFWIREYGHWKVRYFDLPSLGFPYDKLPR